MGALAATLETMRRQLRDASAEVERRRSELEAVVAAVAEGVLAVDRDRRVRFLSAPAGALLGVEPAAALGMFCGDLLRATDERGERPCDESCPILHARFRGAARAVESIEPPGGARSAVVRASPPADGLQVVILAEETPVEAAQRARDAAVADLAHELQTPLAAQAASLELLRERAVRTDPGALELVLALEAGTLRLRRLIDNLLESVRIESGELSLHRVEVHLDEVIEEAVAHAGPLLARQGQHLELDLPHPLPPLAADPGRLAQVFVNLLSNASKYAPSGSTVRVGGRVGADAIELWVEDEGPGFPPGAAPESAGRFRRAGADPRAPGTGLGLWISRSILERHGGALRVDRQARPDAGDGGPAAPGVDVKILVVDDDADLRAVVAFTLRDAGYLVVAAADGPSALALAEAERPALVVLDLNLPGEDGLSLLPKLLAPGPASVLVLSVRSGEEDVVRALDLGADDYLTKPFSPRTLLARVRAVLRRAGIERPEPLSAGALTVDVERRTVSVDGGAATRLTPLELRLLQFLFARAGETVPAERLLLHVWGGRLEGDRQALKQLVHRLRQKLEPDPAAPVFLVTEAGEGYRLETAPR